MTRGYHEHGSLGFRTAADADADTGAVTWSKVVQAMLHQAGTDTV